MGFIYMINYDREAGLPVAFPDQYIAGYNYMVVLFPVVDIPGYR
jgi:hypothetical protein